MKSEKRYHPFFLKHDPDHVSPFIQNYTGDFGGLVYGVLPDEADIVGTLDLIKERLAGIEWQISLPEERNE